MTTAEHTLPSRTSLPPATWTLFSRLSRLGNIAGFTLVGGTALAINEQHRLNECHPTYPYEAVRSRLLKQTFSLSDPGYDALVDKDLPINQLTADLARLIEQFEIALTRQLLDDELR